MSIDFPRAFDNNKLHPADDYCGSVRTFTLGVDDRLRNYIGKPSFKNLYFVIAYNPQGRLQGARVISINVAF